ncbi:MAG: pantoate--beta-alanine ligase, partial [Deltaproteobacteria bacterium]|nr:pantoate--beta-alanine ligase [Deltaproteobacteria bacterium]
READGLALSSRNAYLSPRERQTAPELARALNATRDALTCVRPGSEGGALVAAATAGARARLESFGFGVQYVECLELPELAPATRLAADRPYLIAAAAHLGATRLIDNVLVAPEKLAAFGINVELG